MNLSEKTYAPVQLIGVTTHQEIPAGRFVTVGGLLAPAGGRALGVSETRWSSQTLASVISLGTALVEMSGACVAGDDVTSDANGLGKKAGAGDAVNGRALDAASAGEVIRVKLVP